MDMVALWMDFVLLFFFGYEAVALQSFFCSCRLAFCFNSHDLNDIKCTPCFLRPGANNIFFVSMLVLHAMLLSMGNTRGRYIHYWL